MTEGVKQFNVYVPVDLVREVKLHAVETEPSLAGIVATALHAPLRMEPGLTR